MIDDTSYKSIRLNAIQEHIKNTNEIIKRYRSQAKELSAAANELAKGNAKLKRELKRVYE